MGGSGVTFPPPWRYAYASVQGTSHVRHGIPCQDASLCRVVSTSGGEPVLVALVSDGAGSAIHADTGSRMACEAFLTSIHSSLDAGRGVRDLNEDIVKGWIHDFGLQADAWAESNSVKRRDLACTMLAAVIGTDGGITFQIGDGAIVVSDRRDASAYCYVYWPQQGEYENITYFLTDEDAEDRLEYGLMRQAVNEVAMFSDGVQRLALRLEEREVHNPFFRPLFPPIRSQPPGHLVDLSASLAMFLGSQAVNARTDDDKTLLLATRLVAEPDRS